MTPEALRDALPDYALGLLSESDAAEVTKFLRGNAAARAEARLYQQASDALVLSAPPAPPLPPDVLERILAFVHSIDPARPTEPIEEEEQLERRRGLLGRLRSRHAEDPGAETTAATTTEPRDGSSGPATAAIPITRRPITLSPIKLGGAVPESAPPEALENGQVGIAGVRGLAPPVELAADPGSPAESGTADADSSSQVTADANLDLVAPTAAPEPESVTVDHAPEIERAPAEGAAEPSGATTFVERFAEAPVDEAVGPDPRATTDERTAQGPVSKVEKSDDDRALEGSPVVAEFTGGREAADRERDRDEPDGVAEVPAYVDASSTQAGLPDAPFDIVETEAAPEREADVLDAAAAVAAEPVAPPAPAEGGAQVDRSSMAPRVDSPPASPSPLAPQAAEPDPPHFPRVDPRDGDHAAAVADSGDVRRGRRRFGLFRREPEPKYADDAVEDEDEPEEPATEIVPTAVTPAEPVDRERALVGSAPQAEDEDAGEYEDHGHEDHGHEDHEYEDDEYEDDEYEDDEHEDDEYEDDAELEEPAAEIAPEPSPSLEPAARRRGLFRRAPEPEAANDDEPDEPAAEVAPTTVPAAEPAGRRRGLFRRRSPEPEYTDDEYEDDDEPEELAAEAIPAPEPAGRRRGLFRRRSPEPVAAIVEESPAAESAESAETAAIAASPAPPVEPRPAPDAVPEPPPARTASPLPAPSWVPVATPRDQAGASSRRTAQPPSWIPGGPASAAPARTAARIPTTTTPAPVPAATPQVIAAETAAPVDDTDEAEEPRRRFGLFRRGPGKPAAEEEEDEYEDDEDDEWEDDEEPSGGAGKWKGATFLFALLTIAMFGLAAFGVVAWHNTQVDLDNTRSERDDRAVQYDFTPGDPPAPEGGEKPFITGTLWVATDKRTSVLMLFNLPESVRGQNYRIWGQRADGTVFPWTTFFGRGESPTFARLRLAPKGAVSLFITAEPVQTADQTEGPTVPTEPKYTISQTVVSPP